MNVCSVLDRHPAPGRGSECDPLGDSLDNSRLWIGAQNGGGRGQPSHGTSPGRDLAFPRGGDGGSAKWTPTHPAECRALAPTELGEQGYRKMDFQISLPKISPRSGPKCDLRMAPETEEGSSHPPDEQICNKTKQCPTAPLNNGDVLGGKRHQAIPSLCEGHRARSHKPRWDSPLHARLCMISPLPAG